MTCKCSAPGVTHADQEGDLLLLTTTCVACGRTRAIERYVEVREDTRPDDAPLQRRGKAWKGTCAGCGEACTTGATRCQRCMGATLGPTMRAVAVAWQEKRRAAG